MTEKYVSEITSATLLSTSKREWRSMRNTEVGFYISLYSIVLEIQFLSDGPTWWECRGSFKKIRSAGEIPWPFPKQPSKWSTVTKHFHGNTLI